jgi:hypothetical protein
LKSELEDVIDAILQKATQDAGRLGPLADFAKLALEQCGLPGVRGGQGGELRVVGLARTKAWDVAYEYAGKFRLLISLKSIWKNAGGAVPNRIDDLMGEAANIQQLAPEIVIGYILVFDAVADIRHRKDGTTWSAFFEQAVKRIAIRDAPLLNQGLLEASWFILINSEQPYGRRLAEPEKAVTEGQAFFHSLVKKLQQREPAIPFTRDPETL